MPRATTSSPAAMYAGTDLPDDQLLALARHLSVDQRAAVLQAYAGRRRSEGTQQRNRATCVAAGRVDGNVGRIAKSGDALGRLPPIGEPLFPSLGGLSGKRGRVDS